MCVARLRSSKNREERELLPVYLSPSLNCHGGENREAIFQRTFAPRPDVHAARFQNCPLEATERRAELFVGPSVDAPAYRSKKSVKRERNRPVVGESRFRVTMQNFYVDVLIERAGYSVTGKWQHPPASTADGRVCYCRLVGGVAQPEYGKRFQRPVKMDGAVRGAPAGCQWHVG